MRWKQQSPGTGHSTKFLGSFLTVLGMVFGPINSPLRVDSSRTMSGCNRPEAGAPASHIFICGEGEMDRLDAIYQETVDLELDRLARLSPCELMQLKPKSWKVDTEQGLVEVVYSIFDGGDHRRIAVMAERPVLLGFAKRKFVGALKVRLGCERLSSYEVADLYD